MPPESLMRHKWSLDAQMIAAVRNREVDRVCDFLQAGADPDTNCVSKSTRRPVLFIAVENNDTQMVQMLIRMGASTNQSDASGETALHLACSNNYPTLAALLLRERANCNARTHYGRTALHMAAGVGSLELVRELISHGVQVNVQDQSRRSALHLAAASGHSQIVMELLNFSANITLLDCMRNSALHYAVSYNGVDISAITEMIKKCPQILCFPNCSKETVLTSAIISKRCDVGKIVDTILELSMRLIPKYFTKYIIGYRTDRGHTPLHLAVLERQPECIRSLLAAGAVVDTCDSLGFTPLLLASRDGTKVAVQLLLSAGAKSTPLILAWERNAISIKDIDILSMLKDSEINPKKLSDICRNTISKHWQNYISCKMLLPQRWRDFLSYEQIAL